MKTKYLVVGGNGNVGSEIVRGLKARGADVRVTTSRLEQAGTKDGVEKVHVNLFNGQGVHEAFEGITRVFLLSPAGNADQYSVLSPLIAESKRRNVDKVVLMTAMGANADETSPMRRAEIELEKSGLKYNIIRPNWFLQNFNSFWVQGILEQAKILLPAGSAKVSFVDTRDVSAAAVELLMSDRFENQDFDLTGPESIDHSAVAMAISKATGKSIHYQSISPEELKKGLLGAGLTEEYTQFLLLIFGFLREGYAARVTDALPKIIGRIGKTVDQYSNDYRKVWA